MHNVHAACDGGLAPAQHTIEAGGITWRYLRWGDHGPPLVLWHGVTSAADSWWRVGPTLAGLGFQVVAPDLPGHGGTGESPHGYTVAATARLLDAWLVAAGIDQPVLLGHSWGGVNALAHALLPDARVRARALVLEDPALLLAPDPDTVLPSFTGGIGDEPSDELIAALVAANPRWDRCDAVTKASALYQVRRPAVEGFFRDNAGIDMIDSVARIDVPTLLLLGDPDFGGIWPRRFVDRLVAAAPAVRVEMIAQSSHNPHRDSFAAFSTILGSFVRAWADRARR